ncbi:MAG: DHHA1 domain-containing protein [Desulfurococcales archaeon]|nr:DHHA1 domain-containing protein [Desulfurococcales archaeon]
MGHTFIVTHTDLDGIGSAVAALKALGLEPGEATIVFAEPYNLHEKLGSLAENVSRGDVVVIADLGLNEQNYRDLLKAITDLSGRGTLIEWYDHHVWDPGRMGELGELGVRLFIDRSTCATGVVARHAFREHGREPDDQVARLARIVCSADLWVWDEPLSPKLFRVVGSPEEGYSSEEWRMRLVEKMYKGTLWDSEMEKILESYVNAELDGFSNVAKSAFIAEGSCRVAAAYKKAGPPPNSMIGAMLLSRFRADIAVIARPNGGLSLRSRSVNVQRIAEAMGGGGHERAAGARISIPFHVKALQAVYRKAVSRWVAVKVLKIAESNRICG